MLAYRHLSGYIVMLLALLAVHIVHRIPRREEPIEQSFQVAVLLGIASYWIPSVLFLILPIWVYLIYRNIFSLRCCIATLIGLALVAVWVLVLNYLSIFNFQFSIAHNLWAWIPVGAFLMAYIASTIARQNLRVR